MTQVSHRSLSQRGLLYSALERRPQRNHHAELVMYECRKVMTLHAVEAERTHRSDRLNTVLESMLTQGKEAKFNVMAYPWHTTMRW